VTRVLFLIIAAFTVLGTACSSSRRINATAHPSDPERVVVATALVQRRDLEDAVTLTGTMAPFERVTIYARATGYLRWLKVDIGDRVRQGEVIAKLDVPEIETQLAEKKAAVEQAEATLGQARAALDQNRAEAEFSELNFRRLKSIHDRDADVLPQQDVDQARSGLAVSLGKQRHAETQVKAAQAAIAGAKAELNTLETLMRYATVEAPLNGVVTERFVDPGALIQAASSSRTQAAPLVTMAQVDRLRVFVDVPEPDSPFVFIGTPAAVEAPDLPEERFESRVTRTSDVLDPGSRTMRVEVDLDNRSHRLRPGMTARVSLRLRHMRGAITVPVSAVRTRGTSSVVYVVDGDTAHAVRVSTGLETPEWVQITTGLRGGERVITSAAGELNDGVKVVVRS
jgi:RND family efflux transporter MFP subunit